MERGTELAALEAQRAAIQEARARYERGEITYDDFRRALDALVLAQDAGDCAAILDALPASPLAALAALEPSVPLASPSARPERTRIVAFMGQTKKLRRPWRLAPATDARALMGEVKLDLSVAELPPRARLRVTAIMGTAVIYVPRTVRVAVRSTVLLGDANLLGEGVSGVVASGHEEHTPAAGPEDGPAAAQLEIEAFILMGSVKVALTDGPTISVGELVRDTLRLVADGVRRGLRSGLQAGASPRPLPGLPPGAESAGGEAAPTP